MAIRKFLVTTSVEDARPLMHLGTSVYSLYPQISSLLARRFGAAHAALLAEPLADPANNSVDWYAGISGPIRRWSDLSPADRDGVTARLQTLAAGISAHADELRNGQDPDQARIGSFLAQALTFPDERCLYVVGDQPVLVCWGFTQAKAAIQPQSLTRFAAAPPSGVTHETITRPDIAAAAPAAPAPVTRSVAAPVAAPVVVVPAPVILPAPVVVQQAVYRPVSWLPILAFLCGLVFASLLAYVSLFVLSPHGHSSASTLAELHQYEMGLRNERAQLLGDITRACKTK
jgi:hypothetical protein